MNNEIQFYIFGIPDGFDIYQETQDSGTKSYYQCFYNESITETTRFAINRKVNGEVSYTFLKYHLFSSENRSNAFLGLSVVLKNEYYADSASLYNLLDYAYRDILQKGILLKPTSNGNSAQFLLKTFMQEPEEVKRIESFIVRTLYSEDYVEEFHPLDGTFSKGKLNAILKIPFQLYDEADKEKELNLFILDKLRQYTWLSLSPDYKVKEHEELDPYTRKKYEEDISEIKDRTLSAFEQLLTEQNTGSLQTCAANLQKTVEHNLVSIRIYNEKQDDLGELLISYMDISGKLKTLIEKIDEKLSKEKIRKSSKETDEEKDRDENTQLDDGKGKPEGDKKKQKGGKKLIIVSGIFAACFLFCFFYFVFFYNDNKGGAVFDFNEPAATSNTDSAAIAQYKLDSLVGKFARTLQPDSFNLALARYHQLLDGCEEKGLKKAEDLLAADSFLKNIDGFDVKILFEFYSDLKDGHKSLLKKKLSSALKSYVQENMKNENMRDTLVAIINEAKNYECIYEGYEQDLSKLRKTNPSANVSYELLVSGENGESFSAKVTDVIKLKRGILYTIKVRNGEENAKFGYSNSSNDGVTYAMSGSGSNASLNVKVRGDSVIEGFTAFYKRGNEILFNLKFQVIKNKQPGRV